MILCSKVIFVSLVKEKYFDKKFDKNYRMLASHASSINDKFISFVAGLHGKSAL